MLIQGQLVYPRNIQTNIITFMEASFKQDNKLNKAERYQTFLTQFAPLIEGEKNEISVLANV